MRALFNSEMLKSVLRSRWMRAFQIAVTLLLVAWILSSIDRQIWASLTQTSKTTLILSLLLFSSAQIFGGLRLALLIPGKFPWREALATTWAGYFWSNFLPGSIGGDFVRALRLRNSGMNLPGAAGALVLDRLFNLATIGAIVALAALLLSYRISSTIDWLSALAIVGGGLGAVCLALALLRTRFRDVVSHALMPFLLILRSPGKFLAAICLSACSIGASLVAQWLLAVNLGIGISFLGLAGIICLVTILVMLPVSVNGLGLQEASLVTLLVSAGVAQDKALIFALLVRGLILGAGAIAGIIVLMEKLKAPDSIVR